MAKGVASYLATVALGQPHLKFNDLCSEMAHHYWKLLEIQIKSGRCQNLRLQNR